MNIRRVFGEARRRNPVPEGSLAVGAGLVVAGLTAYGFLVISARALGPERYASLSALWALVFLIGPGFFFPIEQEVSRALSARRARGLGAGPLIRRAAGIGGLIAAGLLIASFVAARPLLDRLFDEDLLLFVALVLGFLGYFLEHLARGVLSGSARFSSYGVVIGGEGVVRLLACLALAMFAVRRAGAYGLAVGIAPFLAVAIGVWRRRDLLTEGPDAPWAELSSAIGYLLVGSVLAQFLVTAGPLAVKILAAPAEKAAAGRFLAGVVITRIPLFLFQAVQAALLPKLSGYAAAGRHGEFLERLRRLLIVVLVLGIASTLGAFAIGPWVIRLLFGARFALARTDLTYLAAAGAAYMMAVALAQALIALSAHARVAVGWIFGVVAFFVVTALETQLFARVEHGLLAGSLVAAVSMGALLVPRLAAGEEATPEDLVEAARGVAIEP